MPSCSIFRVMFGRVENLERPLPHDKFTYSLLLVIAAHMTDTHLLLPCKLVELTAFKGKAS